MNNRSMKHTVCLILAAFLLTACTAAYEAPATPEAPRRPETAAGSTAAADSEKTGGETDPAEDHEREAEAMKPRASLVLEVNGKTYYPELMENPSAEAFAEKLSEERLEVELHDYGSFEKVGPLPWELVRSDEKITTKPGDIILYQGNQITIYYDENTCNFTKLAEIRDVDADELRAVLGEGDVTASFHLEWSE